MEEALAESHSPAPNSQVTQPTAKTLKGHHTGTGVRKSKGAEGWLGLISDVISSAPSVEQHWRHHRVTSFYHKVLTVTTQAGALPEELHQPTPAHQQ